MYDEEVAIKIFHNYFYNAKEKSKKLELIVKEMNK